MEKHGYDVSYLSNVDTHVDTPSPLPLSPNGRGDKDSSPRPLGERGRGEGLLRAKGWLSVGHDEYWSVEMYRHVKAAIAAGVNVAFFSADTCIGLIPFLPSTSGVPNRIISRVGNFGARMDEWAKNGAPEVLKLKQGPDQAALIGARDVYPYSGGGDWTCRNEKHWIFAGTGMKNGDGIPGLVGWEWHGEPARIRGLEVLAQGPAKLGKHEGTYAATIYPGPKGNFVFNAATIWWADGLSAPPGYVRPSAHGAKPKGPDPRVQRITANLLNRFQGKENGR
jgi:hypothetical protein